MPQVRRTRQFAATAADVWSLIGDFYAADTWMFTVTRCAGAPEQRMRTLFFEFTAGPVVEHLVEQRECHHRYEMLDPSPLPLREYRAELWVRDVGLGTSLAEWQAWFEPVGIPDGAAAMQVGGWFTACLGIAAERLAT